MRKLLTIMAATLLWGIAAHAQAPEVTVRWRAEARQIEDTLYEIILTGNPVNGWHTYSTECELSATTATLGTLENCSPEGSLYDITKPEMLDGDPVYFGTFQLGQKIRVSGSPARVEGYVTWTGCNDQFCATPEDWEFSFNFGGAGSPEKDAVIAPTGTENNENKNVSPINNSVSSTEGQSIAGDAHSSAISDPESASEEGKGSLWTLIIEAVLWGFAMLLTPCVFPMVPMTISFFMKGSSSPAAGRFKAFMYGLFIVLLYTLPITVIILITRIVGGDAVTADIFNWLATHWLPNIIFFIVFMIFAASFFGAFEITLPSSLVNKSDKNADKGGLAGIFFMALTLVLVSFSCTGPIVGSVLIKSTQGEFWTPIVTMLAFSVAFALPFTILALFPSLLTKMKSGSWLNSVKVVLGFIEVALGFKFLSVADQTYHWGLLDREIYLAIWITVFSLLGLYLLGKIKFPHDNPEQKPLTVFRLSLVIAVFSFVVYLVPGLWGAPLKALSGYLPPIETQDFVVYSHADGPVASAAPAAESAATSETARKYGLKLPLGLSGYFTLEEGLEAARREGKPLFVDITGHGCVNCREMEQRVWSDPRVLEILRNDYVITALYTDDKSKLEEKDWVTTDSGKVLKDFGRVNSYIVRTRFGVNAQPNYALLDPEGNLMLPIRGYNLDVDAFVAFLQSGIEAFNRR